MRIFNKDGVQVGVQDSFGIDYFFKQDIDKKNLIYSMDHPSIPKVKKKSYKKDTE